MAADEVRLAVAIEGVGEVDDVRDVVRMSPLVVEDDWSCVSINVQSRAFLHALTSKNGSVDSEDDGGLGSGSTCPIEGTGVGGSSTSDELAIRSNVGDDMLCLVNGF